jgi:S-adenosylmethionine hydrolase
MPKHKLLVFQTDFGRLESTVAEMYGVALGVDPDLRIHETTHYIPQFNIRDASFRLYQALPWWPEGTVFVSVVDPGVGSARRSVVAKTAGGHYVVTPDNGTLTHVAHHIGLSALRLIDEEVNRLPGSAASRTFHGRDIYGYTGARLASGCIGYEEVGPEVDTERALLLPLSQPRSSGDAVEGIIEIIDLRYGNVWTNIPSSLFEERGFGDGSMLKVSIGRGGEEVYRSELPYTGFFSAVAEGEDLVYNNELLFVSLAVNQDSFAEKHAVASGPDWKVRFEKIR